jgi:peptide deformylase (EC 3.5.1.88)
MSLLTILHHPDPRLRNRGEEVSRFDASLQTLIDDMFETMYAAPGVGLAATQIGVALRLSVMDCSEDRDQPMVMINPQIVSRDALQEVDEGCLSVPEISDRVQRYQHVSLKALDRAGKPYELEADGLLAQCIQHEIDHLDGKLYIDYLSPLKRERIRKKLLKQQRAAR